MQSKNPLLKTLLIATTSYAGMGPYVASIVNSFSPEDNVRFFLVEDNRKYYTSNIKEELKPHCRIIQCQNGKLKTLLNLTVHPSYYFHNELKSIVTENEISTIHCLTSFHDPAFIKWFNDRGKFILTVHDLEQHESNKAFFKEIRQNIFFNRMSKCISLAKYLVTNSKLQYDVLNNKYSDKQLFYIPFPTLITKAIANGNKECPEIKGISDYILFFGRIEEYKGLSILIQAFAKAQINETLVIAGKGNFVGKVSSPSIIYIDRYIDDEEIRDLYEKSKYIVYPYISATQSGVLSVASYFHKPMLLSDIPFFKESIKGYECGIFFKSKDIDSLADAMKEMNNADLRDMSLQSCKLYENEYSQYSYKNNLTNIYNNLI